MLEKKEQPSWRSTRQTGFIQHITEGNSEAATDKSRINSLENSEIYMLVYCLGCVMQQVVPGNYCIAEKGLEYSIMRFVVFFM